jgi:hypothetical protein
MRERRDQPPQPALVNLSQLKEFGELTPRQRQSIPVVLSTRTVQEGCRLAGISEPTYYAWLKVPAFKAEVERQRELVIAEGLSKLKSLVSRAVEKFETLLDDEGNKPLQFRVADRILEHFFRFREIETIEGRLAQLERLMDIQRRR